MKGGRASPIREPGRPRPRCVGVCRRRSTRRSQNAAVELEGDRRARGAMISSSVPRATTRPSFRIAMSGQLRPGSAGGHRRPCRQRAGGPRAGSGCAPPSAPDELVHEDQARAYDRHAREPARCPPDRWDAPPRFRLIRAIPLTSPAREAASRGPCNSRRPAEFWATSGRECPAPEARIRSAVRRRRTRAVAADAGGSGVSGRPLGRDERDLRPSSSPSI